MLWLALTAMHLAYRPFKKLIKTDTQRHFRESPNRVNYADNVNKNRRMKLLKIKFIDNHLSTTETH
jgi:hypothetical protein